MRTTPPTKTVGINNDFIVEPSCDNTWAIMFLSGTAITSCCYLKMIIFFFIINGGECRKICFTNKISSKWWVFETPNGHDSQSTRTFFLFRYYKKSGIQFTVISQLIIKKFWNLSIFLKRLGWSKKFSFRKIHGHFRKLAKLWIVPSLFCFTCCHSI